MKFIAKIDTAIGMLERDGTEPALLEIMRIVRAEYTKAVGEAEVNRDDAERFRMMCERPELLVALYNAFKFDQYGPTLIDYARKLLDNPPEEDINAPAKH